MSIISFGRWAPLAVFIACDAPDAPAVAPDPDAFSASLVAPTPPAATTPIVAGTTTPTTPTTPTEPSRWEVPPGADGHPLPLEERLVKAHEDLAAMRAERRRVFALGSEGSDDAVLSLVAKVRGKVPAYERLEAIQALGPVRREAAIAALIEALADPEIRVAAEAAITLYKWGETTRALPYLKEFARRGAQVARAFHVDYRGTRPVWAPGAVDFLTTALASPVPEVRIDAAAGLLELGPDDEAVRVLSMYALQAERADERRYAVLRMAHVRDVPAVRTLLARASRDPSPEVATTARQVLSGEHTP